MTGDSREIQTDALDKRLVTPYGNLLFFSA